MGQKKLSRPPKRIVLDVQLSEVLCKHTSDKLEISTWGKSIYLKCETCSIDVELPLKEIILKVSVTSRLLAPIPSQEPISHVHEFTKYDEELLRKFKISIPEEPPSE